MSEFDIVELKEEIPKFNILKCQILATLLWLFLQYFIYIVMLIVWIWYDFFLSIFALMISFLIIGIIRSKLRYITLLPKHLELEYDDKSIAYLYVAKNICFEKKEF